MAKAVLAGGGDLTGKLIEIWPGQHLYSAVDEFTGNQYVYFLRESATARARGLHLMVCAGAEADVIERAILLGVLKL